MEINPTKREADRPVGRSADVVYFKMVSCSLVPGV